MLLSRSWIWATTCQIKWGRLELLDFGERKQLDCEKRLLLARKKKTRKKHSRAFYSKNTRVFNFTLHHASRPKLDIHYAQSINKLKLNKFQIIFFTHKQFQSKGKIKISRISFFFFEKLNFNLGWLHLAFSTKSCKLSWTSMSILACTSIVA